MKYLFIFLLSLYSCTADVALPNLLSDPPAVQSNAITYQGYFLQNLQINEDGTYRITLLLPDGRVEVIISVPKELISIQYDKPISAVYKELNNGSLTDVTTKAQQPSISKMDSTKSSITVVPQNYTYENVYTVVSSINVNNSMMLPSSIGVNAVDSITISASVILYASKSAYLSGAQSLTSMLVYFKWPSAALLPDHYTIKKNIYSKL